MQHVARPRADVDDAGRPGLEGEPLDGHGRGVLGKEAGDVDELLGLDEHEGAACGLAQTLEVRGFAPAGVDQPGCDASGPGTGRERRGGDARCERGAAVGRPDPRRRRALEPELGHLERFGDGVDPGFPEALERPCDRSHIRLRPRGPPADLVGQGSQILDQRRLGEHGADQPVDLGVRAGRRRGQTGRKAQSHNQHSGRGARPVT